MGGAKYPYRSTREARVLVLVKSRHCLAGHFPYYQVKVCVLCLENICVVTTVMRKDVVF
jgi:hypothetical protein